MVPKNGRQHIVCMAHQTIELIHEEARNARTAAEDALSNTHEIKETLENTVKHLINSVDAINQTLVTLLRYGLIAIAATWFLDHFGIDAVSKLIAAAKAAIE